MLVVEDDRSVRDVVCSLLDGLGYDVIQATHGTAAIVIAKGHAGRIDVLLADVVMPGMSGPELAERLHRERPQMAVVLMSGFAGARQQLPAGRPGGLFLAKPFDAPELARVIRQAIETRGQADRESDPATL